MIELRRDQLVFSFPEVHPSAVVRIEFQRTLRIHDDGKNWPLPPGLGAFPLRHVDDSARRVPPAWLEHGGVMFPMYQAEAMWVHLGPTFVADRGVAYPFAIKVATGKIDAVSGQPWRAGLHHGPQDYVVVPDQPWLDGYCVEKGIIRQFVAMPLGEGYTAEEQLTGKAEHGGLQILAAPMRREVFERRFPEMHERPPTIQFSLVKSPAVHACREMGLAPGGRMTQEIFEDAYDLDDWDLANASRCFVHIANSLQWRQITGQDAPPTPATAAAYTAAGLPWFLYYNESQKPLEGSAELAGMKGVSAMQQAKGIPAEHEPYLPIPANIRVLRRGLGPHQVREFED